MFRITLADLLHEPYGATGPNPHHEIWRVAAAHEHAASSGSIGKAAGKASSTVSAAPGDGTCYSITLEDVLHFSDDVAGYGIGSVTFAAGRASSGFRDGAGGGALFRTALEDLRSPDGKSGTRAHGVPTDVKWC